jgi:putative ABC transport system permease protein
MIATILSNVRYAARSLRHAPGFALAAILTLAVGIAANAAIFSVFEAVLLRPLPYAAADRLYVIREVGRGTPIPVNALHFEEWRTHVRSFDRLALIGATDRTLTGFGAPAQLRGARVTPSLFSTLGITPAMGRSFLEEENVVGRDAVVVLTHQLWATRFNADPTIVNRTVTLDGLPHVVVGVLPAGAELPRLSELYGLDVDLGRAEFYTPFAPTDRDLRLIGSYNYVAIGRLRAGVSVDQAAAEINAVQADLAARAPQRVVFGARLIAMPDQLASRSKLPLQIVLGTVALVLLVACINLANLLLVRGGRRVREFAIRRATGARGRDLIAHVLTESSLLAAAAGIVGLAVGAWLVELLRHYAPTGVPRLDDVSLNGTVVAFTFFITLISGLLIGLLPAIRSTRSAAVDVLRSSATTSASRASAGRLRSTLVAIEVAASTVCVVGAVLLLSSFVNLMRVDRGFDTERIVTAALGLMGPRYDTPAKQTAFMTELADQLRSRPGVRSVGITDALPLNGVSSSAIMIEGSTLPRPDRPAATIRAADHDYFRTMGIPLRTGRLLEASDADRRVAVISELAAARLWPGENPIGKRFRHGPDDSPLVEVVGVVGNVRSVSLSANPPMHIYRPAAQYLDGSGSLAARTTVDPSTIATAIGDIVRRLDPEMAVPTPRTMDEIVSESVAQRRFQMNLVLLLGAAAVLLAGLGIYAVVAQGVSQRIGEFGIRMALGADGARIRRLVVHDGMRPVVLGLIVGASLSLAASRLMQSLLFGVSPTDGRSYVIALIFLSGVALAASLAPAWRASRLDPNTALRIE